MSDSPSSPLLGSPKQPSTNHSQEPLENTPLLLRTDSAPRYDGASIHEPSGVASPAARSLRSVQNGGSLKSKDNRRWPTLVAILCLGVLAIIIILGAFFAPAIAVEYAKEAMVIEPTNLSVDSFTASGVRARVRANFRLDASKVGNKNVRNMGRFGTWIARAVESKLSKVEVYLPEYGNVLLGTAAVPPVLVDIRNGQTTEIDFLADLEPGDIEGIRQVANDWLEGRLGEIRVLGKATLSLKSGIFSLGSQSISESMVFEGNDLPAIPQYKITRLNFREVPVPTSGHRGMAADVSLSLANTYPIKLSIPPLGFDILVQSCDADDDYIRLADATTGTIDAEPYSDVAVNIGGIIRDLPKTLVQNCPHSHDSPLDLLLDNYVHGNDTTIFVRGSNAPDSNTPDWITKIISSITVPVPFPGHSLDKVIKEFSLTDTKFFLPDSYADPGSDEANPQISGSIVVTAGLPKEMNFRVNVTRVRASAEVFFKGKKLGDLNLHRWQNARSERVEPKKGEDAALVIKARIEKAPLYVTDDDVLTDILMSLLVGSRVELKVEALVDVEVSTVLGELVIKKLPAEGVVPVKPISEGGDYKKLMPQVGDLRVLSTSKTSLNLQAKVNFTNPSEYSAQIPYINIHILCNGSIIGDATARNIVVRPGNNTDLVVQATWDPSRFGGKIAASIARELMSQYISGFNTTLTFQTHEGSIPHQPELGTALSKFNVTVPTPRLATNGPDSDKPHFIDDATFHLFTSTATFTLISPLRYSTMFIESINATAFYNHTDPVGHILYDLPFEVPPGPSLTPKLPVDWSFGSVGYEALKKALGGTLELDAKGNVEIKLGQWRQSVWYVGSGIGARVTF
ncbi:uncharacterized protein L3040_005536 [Drepanopeziza brunnea f. sp. 'multigermtubi']|uniref:Pre-rRNA processing protein n=1 Tax=Marssonina brunnea f. sp. multigermtubi (strain MB_m1) TaxID=1072389 RepID=K1W9B9_MARBU|nr:pre-rRNA processing protein [Drepanopeziza brunnea f. sp. 'multigermtubi' MB_m1]EKD13845.1 pre-rRNA processing protein [Drepanopeziza brunnea f. sp. 'multigermtubi' MB_m1]KAJ5040977.1 hypothetical protein L3040_005536 [Drepanopeziza brunnea f. sp. 'multigermtubi']